MEHLRLSVRKLEWHIHVRMQFVEGGPFTAHTQLSILPWRLTPLMLVPRCVRARVCARAGERAACQCVQCTSACVRACVHGVGVGSASGLRCQTMEHCKAPWHIMAINDHACFKQDVHSKRQLPGPAMRNVPERASAGLHARACVRAVHACVLCMPVCRACVCAVHACVPSVSSVHAVCACVCACVGGIQPKIQTAGVRVEWLE